MKYYVVLAKQYFNFRFWAEDFCNKDKSYYFNRMEATVSDGEHCYFYCNHVEALMGLKISGCVKLENWEKHPEAKELDLEITKQLLLKV